jgi:hypothetical protein
MSKNALISPDEGPVQYVSGWTTDVPPKAILSPIPNSCRVAEVEDQPFPVSEPLFWIVCADDVLEDKWYYNTSDNQVYPIPAAPPIPS